MNANPRYDAGVRYHAWVFSNTVVGHNRPSGAAIFETEAKKLDAKVKEIYWILGDHDAC